MARGINEVAEPKGVKNVKESLAPTYLKEVLGLVNEGYTEGAAYFSLTESGVVISMSSVMALRPDDLGEYEFFEKTDGGEKPFHLREGDVVFVVSYQKREGHGGKGMNVGAWRISNRKYLLVSPKDGEVRLVENLLTVEREPDDKRREVYRILEPKEQFFELLNILVALKNAKKMKEENKSGSDQ
jgi:hypothetical protein